MSENASEEVSNTANPKNVGGGAQIARRPSPFPVSPECEKENLKRISQVASKLAGQRSLKYTHVPSVLQFFRPPRPKPVFFEFDQSLQYEAEAILSIKLSQRIHDFFGSSDCPSNCRLKLRSRRTAKKLAKELYLYRQERLTSSPINKKLKVVVPPDYFERNRQNLILEAHEALLLDSEISKLLWSIYTEKFRLYCKIDRITYNAILFYCNKMYAPQNFLESDPEGYI